MLSRARPLATTHPVAPAHDSIEREWVARVRLGDERAVESLFEAYYAALCDFVQSFLRSPDSAEDVVQTVFLRIWEHRATWQPTSGVRAYLFAACRNRALGALKHDRVVARSAARVTSELVACATGHGGMAPDEAVQAGELARALRSAVDALPERRRTVVILRWQHQMSYAEIACVLGISVKTVEVHLGRAFAFLRKHLVHLRR
jgi:RNA polymerase sigma-70 factor (ECF subfamily)